MNQNKLTIKREQNFHVDVALILKLGLPDVCEMSSEIMAAALFKQHVEKKDTDESGINLSTTKSATKERGPSDEDRGDKILRCLKVREREVKGERRSTRGRCQ